MQCYLSCMDILILSHRQMNISHLLPPFQGIALMLTWTAWMHATRPWSTRWMAGAVLPQTLWTWHSNSTVSIRHWCLFSGRRHIEFFVFFHNMFNRFNSGFMLIYFLGWNKSHDSSRKSGKPYFAIQKPTILPTLPPIFLDEAHTSLEVYERPLLSITDYNVFHTGPGIPGHWGLLIRKGSLLDLWDLYGHKWDKTDKDRE